MTTTPPTKSTAINHARNRARTVDALRRELLGPDPKGEPISLQPRVDFPSSSDSYKPYHELESGEEILNHERPTTRYGLGVLFPKRPNNPNNASLAFLADDTEAALSLGEDALVDDNPDSEQGEVNTGGQGTRDDDELTTGDISSTIERQALRGDGDSDDFDLGLANTHQPRSLGISCLAQLTDDGEMVVSVTGGRYERVPVRYPRLEPRPPGATAGDTIPQRQGDGVSVTAGRAATPALAANITRDWFVRRPVQFQVRIAAGELLIQRKLTRRASGAQSGAGRPSAGAPEVGPLTLDVEIVSRLRPGHPDQRLLTVCLVNNSPVEQPTSASGNEYCLFQTEMTVRLTTADQQGCILPYPSSALTDQTDDHEEAGLRLLYRQRQVFATGHGCAADWAEPVAGCTSEVRCDVLPSVEVAPITAELTDGAGRSLAIPMATLAGLTTPAQFDHSLTGLVGAYEEWIGEREQEARSLEPHFQQAARRHLDQCRHAARRMRDGIAYLTSNSKARRAFQLANHAILLQQITGSRPQRPTSLTADNRLWWDSRSYETPDPRHLPPGRGQWRPFQVGFLLHALRSTGEAEAEDREVVELLWFPTGGGKTEAYLCLAAFAIFKRRLEDREDAGVQVLMRYTLRLLTTQQFERSSGLICAMEWLRRQDPTVLGEREISIGIWLGGQTTPNQRKDALKWLKDYKKGRKQHSPFLLNDCPWCRATFTRSEISGSRGSTRRGPQAITPGLKQQAVGGYGTVVFACPDSNCPFTERLPIYTVDEDVYDLRPDFVIGTIDKFAMLAWRPEARALFGIDDDGKRRWSPPGLVIQDELHLITGPLGSVAGLYEMVIAELCTDDRRSPPVLPKIVSATATTRRYQEQTRALYARTQTALFPPPGLSASDSFFAREDRTQAGRLYVGVHATSLGSVQAQWERTLATLVQAPMVLDSEEARDPWWTLLMYCNSLRDMGTAHTLLQSTVQDYARTMWARGGDQKRRYLHNHQIRELTGGLQSGDIRRALEELNAKYVTTTNTGKAADANRQTQAGQAQGARRPATIDVCLATNIIEAGIDIPRLSLMVIGGQPKNTAQYIQVSGRVGRQVGRPGLVVTMYSPAKPRDRSHFEQFRAYHERLYAQVEPSSVTPFAAPTLTRALHAALVAFVRQTGDQRVEDRPWQVPPDKLDGFHALAERRIATVDANEAATLDRQLNHLYQQWQHWKPTAWQSYEVTDDPPLLHAAGAYLPEEWRGRTWSTMRSMRNVDAECMLRIQPYLTEPDALDEPVLSVD